MSEKKFRGEHQFWPREALPCRRSPAPRKALEMAVRLAVPAAVAAAALLPGAFATNGMDIVGPIDAGTAQCYVQSGMEFAIIRGWHSYGAFDAGVVSAAANLWAQGIAHLDTYLFPVSAKRETRHCGQREEGAWGVGVLSQGQPQQQGQGEGMHGRWERERAASAPAEREDTIASLSPTHLLEWQGSCLRAAAQPALGLAEGGGLAPGSVGQQDVQ